MTSWKTYQPIICPEDFGSQWGGFHDRLHSSGQRKSNYAAMLSWWSLSTWNILKESSSYSLWPFWRQSIWQGTLIPWCLEEILKKPIDYQPQLIKTFNSYRPVADKDIFKLLTCCFDNMGRMMSAIWRESLFHLSSFSLWHCCSTRINISRTWWYWISLSSMDTTTSFWVSSSFPASALLAPLNTKRSWTMGCKAGIAAVQRNTESNTVSYILTIHFTMFA